MNQISGLLPSLYLCGQWESAGIWASSLRQYVWMGLYTPCTLFYSTHALAASSLSCSLVPCLHFCCPWNFPLPFKMAHWEAWAVAVGSPSHLQDCRTPNVWIT